ncbi:hypothetical protein LX36DRAFT_393844 [Colletotrichum falcatum]|nr:hypothetical protein LX36DRAFT_393844 [Colletotrichum falcatum]
MFHSPPPLPLIAHFLRHIEAPLAWHLASGEPKPRSRRGHHHHHPSSSSSPIRYRARGSIFKPRCHLRSRHRAPPMYADRFLPSRAVCPPGRLRLRLLRLRLSLVPSMVGLYHTGRDTTRKAPAPASVSASASAASSFSPGSAHLKTRLPTPTPFPQR